MTFARLAARLRRPLRRFVRDKRGVSAIEFALILPLMATLYFGGVEVSQGIAIDRKVTLVARSLGDLVSQSTSVSNADIANILNAATAVVQPYSDTNLKIWVSSVKVDNQGVAKIAWSDTKTGGTVKTPGTVVTLPAALNVANTYLIWAEAEYTYTPTIGYFITKTLPLKDQIYMRPRLTECVKRDAVPAACS